MRARPKILTRRMSRDLTFALDDAGVVPTDSCISLTLLPESKWLRSCREEGLTDSDSLKFCLAVLNSTITKFVLLSRADAWQGEFYQVREDTLGQVPLLSPKGNRLAVFRQVVECANRILDGRDTVGQADERILSAYGLTVERLVMTSFIESKTGAGSGR